MDSIIVKPGGLTNKESVGTFKTENVSGGMIPRVDVAIFMLN